MPAWDRRRYRRMWWKLFHAETFVNLHCGRPCSIRLEDFDSLDLVPDDYLDPDNNVHTIIRIYVDNFTDMFLLPEHPIPASLQVMKRHKSRFFCPGPRPSNQLRRHCLRQ